MPRLNDLLFLQGMWRCRCGASLPCAFLPPQLILLPMRLNACNKESMFYVIKREERGGESG